ncbi:MAG: hypothetical protein AAGA81_05815 [Acidobacteriota bacterium]
MVRASTLTSFSAVVLLAVGVSIAALSGTKTSTPIARISPDIIATQSEPLQVEVELPMSTGHLTSELAEAIRLHPESGVRVLDAVPQRQGSLLVSLDVSRARAGKWTVDFGDRADCRATLTVHQTPEPAQT